MQILQEAPSPNAFRTASTCGVTQRPFTDSYGHQSENREPISDISLMTYPVDLATYKDTSKLGTPRCYRGTRLRPRERVYRLGCAQFEMHGRYRSPLGLH